MMQGCPKMITSILMATKCLAGSDRQLDRDAVHRIVHEHPGMMTAIEVNSTWVNGVRTMVLTDDELATFKPFHDALQTAVSDMFSA
jgi:hypothetical protein